MRLGILLSASLITAMGLTACAGESGTRATGAATWRKAGDDSRAVDQAYQACKAYAEDQALRGAGYDPIGFDGLSAQDPQRQMRAFDTKRTFDRIMAGCMSSQGYDRAPSTARTLDETVDSLRESLRW